MTINNKLKPISTFRNHMKLQKETDETLATQNSTGVRTTKQNHLRKNDQPIKLPSGVEWSKALKKQAYRRWINYSVVNSQPLMDRPPVQTSTLQRWLEPRSTINDRRTDGWHRRPRRPPATQPANSGWPACDGAVTSWSGYFNTHSRRAATWWRARRWFVQPASVPPNRVSNQTILRSLMQYQFMHNKKHLFKLRI